MANTLNGLTPDELGKVFIDCINRQMESLIAQGFTREQAIGIMNAALADFGWNIATWR